MTAMSNEWHRWKKLNQRQKLAAQCAEGVLSASNIRALPVDPFKIAESEDRWLSVDGNDFGTAFDARIEYHSHRNRFIIFYNTSYDRGCPPGAHAARTRFSLAHELAHFHIEEHRNFLRQGGTFDPSIEEFISDTVIEREADVFAANLLMPTSHIRKEISNGELSCARVKEIAAKFGTSLTSTAIRSIEVSDAPCAIAGIRDGAIAWQFLSQSLIERGCYPAARRSPGSGNAQAQWEAFISGSEVAEYTEAPLSGWFRTYRDARLPAVFAGEHYLPIRPSNTLLVLLTIDEEDLYEE